jgi:hypothetical protein
MPNCRNKPPRTCEAWIRIRELSFFGQDERCPVRLKFSQTKNWRRRNIFTPEYLEDILESVLVADGATLKINDASYFLVNAEESPWGW